MKFVVYVKILLLIGIIGSCTPKSDNPAPDKTLKITRLNKYKAGLGSEVVIYGENFAEFPANNIIKFGSEIAPIISGDKSKITTRVPSNLSKGKLKISLAVDAQNVEIDFEIAPLEITKFSPLSGDMGSVVKIEGSGFLSDTSQFELYFYDQKALIQSANDSVITVKVPNNLTLGDVKIAIYKGDEIYQSLTNFQVNNVSKDWQQLNYLPMNVVEEFFYAQDPKFLYTLGDKAYLSVAQKELWEYSKTTDKWSKKTLTFAEGLPSTTFILNACVLNGKPYFLTSYSGVKEIWSFDTIQNQWTLRGTFPAGGFRDNLVMTALNNKIYMGLSPNNFQNNYSDFWEFEPSDDNEGIWTALPDFPQADDFLINDYTPFVGNLSNKLVFHTIGNPVRFWEFNPINQANPWQQKALNGYVPTSPNYFTINGKLYLNELTNGHIYAYAADANQWSLKYEYNQKIFFTIDNFIYTIVYFQAQRKFMLLRASIN